ncbi:MAG: hypothetical protein M3N53_00065 [Actinomycetota bacterium]|nr:hypothetical protein [Actinomycetota bacterium]
MSSDPEGPDPSAVEAIARSKRGADPKTSLEQTRAASAKTDLELKEKYGNWLLTIMIAQLVVADLGFFFYGFFGVGWNVASSVMHVWLVSTVVEVIGVVLVVTQYLFPNRDAG